MGGEPCTAVFDCPTGENLAVLSMASGLNHFGTRWDDEFVGEIVVGIGFDDEYLPCGLDSRYFDFHCVDLSVEYDLMMNSQKNSVISFVIFSNSSQESHCLWACES